MDPAVTRTLLRLAWPIVLSRSAQAVIGFCDALMTAPLGEDALAATTAGATNVLALVILPMGAVFIVQSFSAQLAAREQMSAARRYGWYGLLLAAASMLVGLACTPFIGLGLGLFDFEPPVRTAMADYMAIRIASIGAIVGIEALGAWFGGIGHTKPQMRASIIAMVANVIGNWLLIQGNLGAPALGVVGAAWASAIASWLGFAYILWIFLRHASRHSDRGWRALKTQEFVRMLRFGLPNGINWFLEFAAWVFFINVIVVDLGTVSLAAMMVVVQINAVSFMPAFGIASSGAILVGQAIGGDRKDDVPPIVRATATVAAIWQCGVGLIYFAIPGPLLAMFAPPTVAGPALVAAGASMLRLSAIWQLFDAVTMTASEALRAAGDTTWCLWVRIAIAWLVFIPLGWFTVRAGDGGADWAMLVIAFYIALLSIVFTLRLRSGRWRRIDLTGRDKEIALDC